MASSGIRATPKASRSNRTGSCDEVHGHERRTLLVRQSDHAVDFDHEERGRIPPGPTISSHVLALGSRADEAVVDRLWCLQSRHGRHSGPGVLEDER